MPTKKFPRSKKYWIAFAIVISGICTLSGNGNKELSKIPIPDGFVHLTIPIKVGEQFASEIGVPFADSCYCYAGNLPAGLPFTQIEVWLHRRLVRSVILIGPKIKEFLVEDERVLLPSYEKQTNMVLNALKDSYGGSKWGEMLGWLKESDPNSIKGIYDRIKQRRIWNLEPKIEVYFNYKIRDELQKLLLEAQGSDRNIILNRPIYVLGYEIID